MKTYACAAIVVLTLWTPRAAWAQLYTENFDADHSANWLLSANEASGASPSDGVGDPDASADFFFDYSDVGIPPAPNSIGGTTRGMKIQANLTSGIFGGASASPIGQSFIGNYKITFDLWGNYVGDPTDGLNPGGDRQTNMSTYGITTDGATGMAHGVADAVWFAATVDGRASADFRAYSLERAIGYQLPIDPTALDGLGQPIDSHAVYHAGSRNNSAALYQNHFGGVSAPAAQLAQYPQQTGTTPLGSIGMEWHQVEIAKVGKTVTWTMDGVLLVTLDMTNFTTQPDGSNIFFGHSDINADSSTEPDRFALQFSLFDNIKVESLGAGNNADFNGNGTIDAADFVLWRKNNGLASGAIQPQGDADGDMDVDLEDYDLWHASFGNPFPGSHGDGAVGAVPEPGSSVLWLIAAAGVFVRRRRDCPQAVVYLVPKSVAS